MQKKPIKRSKSVGECEKFNQKTTKSGNNLGSLKYVWKNPQKNLLPTKKAEKLLMTTNLMKMCAADFCP